LNELETGRPAVDATISEATQRREELVLGKPPRIAPLDVNEIADAAIESTKKIRQAAGSATPVSASTIPELVATLLRHPDLFQRVADVAQDLGVHFVIDPSTRAQFLEHLHHEPVQRILSVEIPPRHRSGNHEL